MFDFLLTSFHCTSLHKFMPCISFKNTEQLCLFILPIKFKFQYLLPLSHKKYILKQKTVIEQKTSARRREEIEKSKKNNIRKACKEIAQYYCCNH